MEINSILKKLKSHSHPKNVAGMARFGINPDKTLGVSIPIVRAMARECGKDHGLALKLWASGIHEARILAGMVDVPAKVSEKQMDSWVKDFDSWDVCDQVCMNLFEKVPCSVKKAIEWSKRKEEFVKRAGFALMAVFAVHKKDMSDKEFLVFLPVIKRESVDERNFVKKTVNWALRQIGKRNESLRKHAIKLARELMKSESRSARWIGSDAFKELSCR